MKRSVKVWKDKIVIPTYEVGEAETYPVFLEKRVYQGSSGVVYPHPVVEHISDIKVDKEWEVVYLENDYLKIMVLPALGGRIQMAWDKIRERHFVYYNHVIKPALVGLAGPWISGGIEFNWPQHHRPSTYDPVDYNFETNPDGSCTVWVSELERMFRTKGMAGFTLHPDKAYLEISVQLYNRSPHPQTFLWWANPAVEVNDHYQSVFPPDVHAVFDHGKRDVSEFPIARGEYYKIDYSPGTDISRYRNIPVPTSYMAITSNYDFVGGYDNQQRAGLLHVANHHVSPGKKQWTWGDGDFGHAWDRNLTDKDGPYIELMCGVYTDNQPDFTWLQPYEEKSFKQYFMPYSHVGVVKNATKEALVNLELEGEYAKIILYVTAEYAGSRISLEGGGKILYQEIADLAPGSEFERLVKVDDLPFHELTLKLTDSKGVVLVQWTPEAPVKRETPKAAEAAKQPSEIDTLEQLYLTGLHLEQYRHATYDPTAYYMEALSRDGKDVRNNNAMGLWSLKKGQFEDSISYFDRAIESLTERNPNPYDGEPFFNRGVAFMQTGKHDEAYDSFFKSTWNAAWQNAGYYHLAQIDCFRGDLNQALEMIDLSLIRNWHHHRGRHLKSMILRLLGKKEEAAKFMEESLSIDKFNFGVLFEKYLLHKDPEQLENFKQQMRGDVHSYLEYSLDYAFAGRFREALQLLNIYLEESLDPYPMAFYFMGWYHEQLGEKKETESYYKKASKASPNHCFPNRLEEVIILKAALFSNPKDARAHYYLGNFWYHSRQHKEARDHWEASASLDPNFPITFRNLALLYFNKDNNPSKAREMLEKAFKLDFKNARLLMELSQLYRKLNLAPEFRFKLLEDNMDLVLSRDDLYLEWIELHNLKGLHSKALELISSRKFHPWEGGEGKVPIQYLTANVELAKEKLFSGQMEEAANLLSAARIYPDNLGEGKLAGALENDINYWKGCLYEKQGKAQDAKELWKRAALGNSDPGPAMFYNDQPPDKILYQGWALKKLGDDGAAETRFRSMIDYGQKHIKDQVKIDYFAVSLPDLLIWEDDLNLRNKIHCFYLIGLGKLGLGDKNGAIAELDLVLEMDPYNLPARLHRKLAKAKI